MLRPKYRCVEGTDPKVYRELPQRPIPIREGAVTYLQSRGIGRAIVERYRITTRKDRPDILVFPFYDENNVLAYVCLLYTSRCV